MRLACQKSCDVWLIPRIFRHDSIFGRSNTAGFNREIYWGIDHVSGNLVIRTLRAGHPANN
jgi:hypothetical protein